MKDIEYSETKQRLFTIAAWVASLPLEEFGAKVETTDAEQTAELQAVVGAALVLKREVVRLTFGGAEPGSPAAEIDVELRLRRAATAVIRKIESGQPGTQDWCVSTLREALL